MSFSLENCIVADHCISLLQVQELLQYPQLLTYVLLDLQKLNEETEKPGMDGVITSHLSGEEQDQLETFSLAKRKREWLGGRLAAKYATALLRKQAAPENHLQWSGYIINADENGRPYLGSISQNSSQPMPDISISHSAILAGAMAVHKGFCGIDIQKETPKVFKVAERFCSQDEKQLLEDFFPQDPDIQAAPLTKLWAAKEALRKASNMSSLPGFMEMELIEIISKPLQKETGPWGFSFIWKDSAGLTQEKFKVAVANIEDYALALTARGDTVG